MVIFKMAKFIDNKFMFKTNKDKKKRKIQSNKHRM